MPTITVLVDGTIPVSEDFNGNFRRLNQAIGTGTAITTYTAGDLLYAITTDTLTRLAIGSPGEVLTVAAGLPDWASPGTATGSWGQRNLTGTVTTTTIAVTAYAVALRNASFGTKIHENTGTLTLDSAAQGLNGRDQAAAFTASQTLHAYWISDGTNLRTVLADSAPVTGPDLTTLAAFSGYTYWAYIGPFIWNGSSNFIPARIRGTRVFYETMQVGATGAAATSETAIALSSFVPATALTFQCRILAETDSNLNTTNLHLRVVSGSDYFVFDNTGGGFSGFRVLSEVTFPNVSQQILYLWDANPGAQRDAEVHVLGYSVANGGD